MEGAVSPPSPPSPPLPPSSEEEQFLHISARDVLDPDAQELQPVSSQNEEHREEEQEGSESVERAWEGQAQRDPSEEMEQSTDDRRVELDIVGDVDDDDDDDDDTGMPPLEDVKPSANSREAPPFPFHEDGGSKPEASGPVPGPGSDPAGNSDSTATDLDQCIDVLGNGLLKKKVLRKGPGGGESRPRRRQNVTMRVKSALEDGTVVEEQEALCFTVGDGDVIQALDLCAELMALGEVAEITTDAKYAYGAVGSSAAPTVPSGTALVMEVELLAVSDAPDAGSLRVSDRAALAHRKRERGNYYFQRGDYAHAIASYDRAIKISDTESAAENEDEDRTALLDVKLKCLNNVAAAQLRLDERDAALRSCEAALALQPDSVKALFRKGKVLALQGEFLQAADTLRKALTLEPSNKTIQTELHKLRRQQHERQAEEKTLYKKMLGSMAAPAEDAEHEKPRSWGLPWKWVFGAATVALGSIIVSIIVAARS